MNRKILTTLFLVVFIDLLGFGMIVPILPYYSKLYGATPVELGFLMVCYSGMQFLFAPLWGHVSDRVGRRPVLILSIFGLAASMFLLGIANSLMGLFVARLCSGFFGANISCASAFIADVTPPEKRAQGMGLIGAAFGLGFLFGPALGGALSVYGYGTVAFAVASLGMLNGVFALLFLKEPPITAERRTANRARLSLHRIRLLLARPQTAVPVFVFFLITFAFAQVETSFGLYVLETFGLGPKEAGFMLAGMAFMMVLVQGGLIGRLVKKWGELRLIQVGLFLMTLGMGFSVAVSVVPFFVLSLLLHAWGYAMTQPTLSSLASKSAPSQEQGLVMGVYQSAGSLARVLGPLMAGSLFQFTGPKSPLWSATFLFGVLACFWIYLQKEKDYFSVLMEEGGR